MQYDQAQSSSVHSYHHVELLVLLPFLFLPPILPDQFSPAQTKGAFFVCTSQDCLKIWCNTACHQYRQMKEEQKPDCTEEEEEDDDHFAATKRYFWGVLGAVEGREELDLVNSRKYVIHSFVCRPVASSHPLLFSRSHSSSSCFVWTLLLLHLSVRLLTPCVALLSSVALYPSSSSKVLNLIIPFDLVLFRSNPQNLDISCCLSANSQSNTAHRNIY